LLSSSQSAAPLHVVTTLCEFNSSPTAPVHERDVGSTDARSVPFGCSHMERLCVTAAQVQVFELLHHCMNENPERRPSAAEAAERLQRILDRGEFVGGKYVASKSHTLATPSDGKDGKVRCCTAAMRSSLRHKP
jgi:hypothetical protein